MKTPIAKIFGLLAAVTFALFASSCNESDEHDHDHEHGEHHEHDDHAHDDDHEHGDDHAEHKEEDHDHAHGDHDHQGIEDGPNGGRILPVEPHLEFFVTEDRKVQISAVDDNDNLIPVTTQKVSVIGGSRTNPTRMKFAKEGDVLLSDIAFPEGNDFPVVVQIKTTPGAKAEIVKFNLNLEECPTCDNLEYACTCDHEH